MAYVNIRILRHLKEELGWAIDKRFRLIVCYLKQLQYITMHLKNKAVFNLKHALLCDP